MTGRDDRLMGDSYDDLRNMLIRYLRRLGSSDSEDLADETIYRVLKNLRNEKPIRELQAYAMTVAHNVYLESVRQPATFLIREAESPVFQDEAETLDQCLTWCLQTLTKQERRMFETYHRGRGRALIESRRRLAEKLGITPNALRIEVHRIRKRLRQCVESCAARKKEE